MSQFHITPGLNDILKDIKARLQILENLAGTLPRYTVATLPAATKFGAGSVVFVTDGGGGANFQGSTGSAWVNLG